MRAPDGAGLAAALAFLTRVPRLRAGAARGDLVRAAPLFPLVGAAIGGLVGAAAAGLAGPLPVLAAAAVAIAVELALTGALHLDGLADGADGLAGRDREHALGIMRDPSLGTYGGAALTLDLLAKAAALAALAEAGLILPVVAAFAVGRAAPLPLAAALPYARAEGTGRLLAEKLGRAPAATGLLLAALIAVAAAGWTGAAMLACLALVTATVAALARARLGGVTGDVMGSAAELTTTAALLTAAALAA